jgi:hypothetical protein
VDEFHGDVLRVRAGPAHAEHHELCAQVESHGYGVAGAGHRLGLRGEVADRRGPQLEQ